ncbi:unnamed protein product, partial [marine sediment metagenome]
VIVVLANKGLIDDLQEIALKLGKGGIVRKKSGSKKSFNPNGEYWRLTTNKKKYFRQY